MLLLTAPVSVDKVDDDLAVQSLVERPNKQICQQHKEAHNEATDHEHVAKDQVEGKTFRLHPTPPNTHHCCTAIPATVPYTHTAHSNCYKRSNSQQ